MIFVQPDLTPSVRWELGELVAEMSYLRKTVLVMPHSGGDEWTEIRDGLRQDIGVVLPPHHAGGGMFRLRPGPDDVLVAPNTFILSLTRALEEADCNGKQFDAEEVWEELVADERAIRTNDKKLREIRRDIPLLGRWSLSDGSGAAKSWPEVHSVPAATAVLPAAANDCEAKPKRAKVISKTIRIGVIAAAAILPGIVAIALALYPQIQSWMDRLFASEQDFAHKLEQMIKQDAEKGNPLAIIKEGWPEDYTAMIQAGARAMKETGVKLPAVNAAVDKAFIAWLQRNIMLAVAADDAALQNVLDRVVPFYRRLRATDPELCRTLATASFNDTDTIVRELGRIPEAEVRAIKSERRLITLALVESIASGRRLPQQRPGMGPADYAALFWQLADRGMSLNDFHALQKGLLPAEKFSDKFVNIYEAIASVPDQRQRIRIYLDLW